MDRGRFATLRGFQGAAGSVRREPGAACRAAVLEPVLQGAARRILEGRSIFDIAVSPRLCLAEPRHRFLRLPLCEQRRASGAGASMRRVFTLSAMGLMLAHPDLGFAIDSYRYLHVSIETPWMIFLF